MWRMKAWFSKLGLTKPRFMAMKTIKMLVEPSKKEVVLFVVAQTIGTHATSSLMRWKKESLNMNVQNTLSMY